MRRLVYILALACCISCVNRQTNTGNSSSKIDFSFTDNQIHLNTYAEKSVKFHYSFAGTPYATQSFQKSLNFDVITHLKANTENHNLIAYSYAKEGHVAMQIKDDYQLDTTIYIKLPTLNDSEELSASITSGTCLPLVRKGYNDDITGELKKWLYNNGLHLDDEKIKTMRSALITLQSSNEKEFEPKNNTDIPIIKNFSGINYKVSSNMKADYYYLFAGTSDDEIEEFIGEVISSDFPHSAKSLSSTLNCFRAKNKGGMLYMFLIGINKNWDKQVYPLGLVIVDNIKPYVYDDNGITLRESSESTSSGVGLFSRYNTVINTPNSVPAYTGTLKVSTGYFRGNNANFIISFSGDIESISIKREIKTKYSGLTATTKTVDLKNKVSPQHFTFALDLPIGDNYIPITVKDKRGNVTEHSYKITMVRVEDNNPDININNNIYN